MLVRKSRICASSWNARCQWKQLTSLCYELRSNYEVGCDAVRDYFNVCMTLLISIRYLIKHIEKADPE